ncbi:MAG TPA: ATP-binding protein [Opitutaceae bacterium]|nr:ATP-binding protein [Opitutaceae bacterium]
MSSTGRLSRLRRSVAVRLSVWFAALFAVGFSAIFVLLYALLSRQLEQRDFEALRLRLQQYADIYQAGGLLSMRERISEERETPHVRSLFVRLLGPRGDLVWGRVPPDWIDQDPRRVTVPDGWGGWSVRHVYTVRVPRDQQRDLAVVSTVLPDGLLLQVGRVMDSRSTLLEPLREIFLWIGGSVVLVGFGVGLIAAWRATRPLQNVVETARRIITTGALDARVPMPKRNDDVAELVQYFNTVLDKNTSLLRAMREALDNVAHDLKTPLTSMRGTAELALSQNGGDAMLRDALGECVERADDVLRLLRALMEISEAEAGVLKLEKVPCELGALASSAVDLYAEVADAREIKLTIETGEIAPIVADTTRLRQAIANLVDNAVKYTPAGGAVKVRTEKRDGKAVLSVVDTGPGIPVAEQSRIWERLYRGDQSRSQSGLGLGLSLVRAIIEAHGGTTRVSNGAEGGAVFEIELPLGGGEG